jgi:hypothetical protein
MDNRPEQIPTEQPVPDDEELVGVLDTKEESEAMVVRGLLQSAGIEALVSFLDAPQDVLPGVGGIIVRVRAGEAEQARSIIDDYRQNGDSGDNVEPISGEPLA